MTNNFKLLPLALVVVFAATLSACGSSLITTNKPAEFSNDDQTAEDVTPYVDSLSQVAVKITDNKTLNQEFTVQYKTTNPDGTGKATFKAKSFKEIDKAGDLTAGEGKKLYALELSVKGYKENKGSPSTFNQIGDNPSPQFVLINKAANQTYVEQTDFSEGYTASKDYFPLDKLTMDGDQTVTTAIVFEVDQSQTPDLAFRFVNPQGDIEFYDLSE